MGGVHRTSWRTVVDGRVRPRLRVCLSGQSGNPSIGGLTGYRRAVAFALSRAARGLPEPTWSSTHPAEPLPTDPDWAGEIVYTNQRCQHSRAATDELWKALEATAIDGYRYPSPLGLPTRDTPRWSVEAAEPQRLLRLRANVRAPSVGWLETTVSPQSGGIRYEQRAIFFPRGIPGRLY